jgi:hypothetical protein
MTRTLWEAEEDLQKGGKLGLDGIRTPHGSLRTVSPEEETKVTEHPEVRTLCLRFGCTYNSMNRLLRYSQARLPSVAEAICNWIEGQPESPLIEA